MKMIILKGRIDFPRQLPYRMKIYTEFNLATWAKVVKFMELINF